MSESILKTGEYLAGYEAGITRLGQSRDPSELLTAVTSRLINGASQSELGKLRDSAVSLTDGLPDFTTRPDLVPTVQERDALVLKQMVERNMFDEINGGMRIRHVGSFVIAHFPPRSMRPSGTATEKITRTFEPFDEAKFNYLQVASETFQRADAGDYTANLIFNKFPFTRMHGLWVPRIEEKQPQLLTQPEHEAVLAQISGAPSGYLMGFNGRGAYSSVNHAHFHVMKDDTKVPALVMEEYPAERQVFDHGPDSWQFVSDLNRHNIPSSVLYSPNNVLVFPRQFQGEDNKPDWTSGFAIREMSGVIPVTDRHQFESMDGHEISEALRNASRLLINA